MPKKSKHPIRENDYTYTSYRAMRQRVNPNGNDYKYYKNVKICERWLGENGWDNFYEDMGKRPEGLTLERINNFGNYEPSNCKWATRQEQGKNTVKTFRSNKCEARKLCKQYGISFHTIEVGSDRKGMSRLEYVQIAIKTKLKENENINSYGFKNLRKFCKHHNVNYLSIYNRIKKHGVTPQKALEMFYNSPRKDRSNKFIEN